MTTRSARLLVRCPLLAATLALTGCGSALSLAAPVATNPPCAPEGRLAVVAATTVSTDPRETVQSLVLCDVHDRRISAYLRAPSAPAESSLPVVVLLAGRYAGREAALMIPPPLRAMVLSIEYPAMIPERLQFARLIRELPQVRAEALNVPQILVAAGHFAAAQPGADPSRVALVGVSFGVPFAVIAGADSVFRALVLGFGGAGIADMLAPNLASTPRLVRHGAARLAGWYFRDLEPARHAERLQPTPVLLVNGVYDRQIPHSAAIRLGEAVTPFAEHVWFSTGHIGVGQDDIIRAFAEEAMAFLDRVWAAPLVAGSSAPATTPAVDRRDQP